MIIFWSLEALQDLDCLADFIARDSVDAADAMVERIIQQTARLATFPQSGRPGRIEDTREIVIAGSPYFISYRILDEAVEILAVIHGARRWPV
jgi:toxin ParE1/3/4